MEKKLILTVGAPGSGKSTWAEEQAKDKNIKTIVLNRDDLRAMMFGGKYKYSRSNESLVTSAVRNMIIVALEDKVTQRIIVADTNLNDKTVDAYYKIALDVAENSKDEIVVTQKLFDVNWQTLVARNKVRGNKAVPMEVLRTMHKNMQIRLGNQKTYVPNETLPKAIIFDLDGTLANNDHRGPFEYAKLIDDAPVEHLIDMAKAYSKMGYEIICLSGRNSGPNEENQNQWKSLTQRWLDKNDVPWDKLHMRGFDDFRKDDVIKEEIFWQKIAPHYNVKFAVDDRDQVVEMWRRIGVKCLQCEFGDF